MAVNARTSRIIPVALGVAMVGVIVAVALSPNTGAVPAQSSCQYNQCVGGTGLPWWAFAAIVILILVALAAALILLRRRRTPPRGGLKPADIPSGPTAGASGGATPPPSTRPAYLETPDDVGGALPAVTAPAVSGSVAATAAGAGAGAAAAGDEPDIDSLMAELDKISGEILKRPKNAPDKKTATNDDE